MTWNVLAGRELHESGREVLEDFATITVAPDEGDGDIPDFERYDAVILGGKRVILDSDALDRASNLKVVTSLGVGLDPVDIPAATEHGVIVCNNPGANTRAVAEYTIAAMLAVRRQLRQADRDLRTGAWNKHGYLASEVEGQTFGVVGYGAIGSLVTELATGLGMEAVAYDPYVNAEDFAPGVTPVGDVTELFSRSDAVGVHAPLTDETHELVGKPEFEALGSDGIVVNAARGELMDEEALVAALRSETIWGAAIDVFHEEPAQPDDPLFDLDNLLVSPHIAGSTTVSVPAKHRGGAQNVSDVYEGRLPESTPNRDELCLWAANK